MCGRPRDCKRNSDGIAIGRVRSCVRPVAAAHAAGPDEVRGLGPNQYFALEAHRP